MFCVVGLNQSPTTASFKVTDEEFDEMCSREGFKPAPYVAWYKWVLIDDIDKMNKRELEKYIAQPITWLRKNFRLKLKNKLA